MEALAGPSADRPSVGPFQGQDDSPESNTQAGDFHQSVVDRVRDPPPIVSTGTPRRVSTVDLAVHTPVFRHRSDADMEALTQQMCDKAQFREERAWKTDAMLVTFLSKAKGAPPAVLEAWGISQPREQASSPAQSTGNRDVPSMKSRDKPSRAHRRLRKHLAIEAGSRSKLGGGLATPPLAVLHRDSLMSPLLVAALPSGLAVLHAKGKAEAGACRNEVAFPVARVEMEEDSESPRLTRRTTRGGIP